jgi:Tol biopolymer transport system component
MNVDGTNVERLEPGQSPTWSPDGTQLAFSEAKCGYDFYGYYKVCSGGLAIVDVERWTVARPPIPYDVVLDPAWSPLDDRIAFVSCCDASVNHLYITRLNGSKAGDPVSSQLGYSHPSWSRDAERIAFSCLMLNHATTWDICIVPARGSQLTVLPRRPDDQASRALPAWSPDGTRIAFSRPGQLAIYTVATNEVTTLNEGTEPAWSPDGSMIVFTGQDGLFIINADGSNLHRITRGRHSQAAWRP